MNHYGRSSHEAAEEAYGSQKNLPLRQHASKPILKYNTRGAPVPAPSPVPPPSKTGSRELASGIRPQGVALFNQSDLQYLKQQVSTYASPAVATSLFGATSSSFSYRPQLLSACTFMSSNSATANFTPASVTTTSVPAPPTSSRSSCNPYARPLSAKDLQSHDQIYVSPATLMGTSVVRRSNSSGSLLNAGSNGAGAAGPNSSQANTPNPVVQTNSFLRPQSAMRTNPRLVRSSSRSSVVPANGHQTIVVETRPCSVIDREDTEEKARPKCVDGANSNRSMMPKPPVANKSTRPDFVNHKTDGTRPRPFDNLNFSPPRDSEGNIKGGAGSSSSGPYPGTTPIAKSHIVNSHLNATGSTKSDSKIIHVPTATFQTPVPPSETKPAAGGKSGTTSRGLTSSLSNSGLKVRNLNYTPTKPYKDVCNPDSEGNGGDPLCDENENNELEKNQESQSSSGKSSPEAKTTYYRKAFKTEEIIHSLMRRPKADGAPSLNKMNEKRTTTSGSQKTGGASGVEEWEDVNEVEESDYGERLPGDGEDYNENFDDDDECLDDLDDDLDVDSDEESDAISRGSSARGGRTPVRIRSATKRLLGLSIKDKPSNTTITNGTCLERPHGGRSRQVVAGHRSRPSTAKSRPISAVSTVSSSSDLQAALTPSLFTSIPPTINFVRDGEKVEQLPWEIRKLLKWRMSPITPNVVKNCIFRSGFRPSKKSNDWLGYWGKHMKSPGFKAIREYQKVNHFPGSFQIGRKDRLWRNLSRMQVHFGKKEFSFFPQTFVLPYDLKLLKRTWEDGGNKQKWIIKPPASARGIGIKVIHKWNQIPRRRSVIVQKYLARPYLINESKFDLRIYVYVTSYDPLRIYVYDDGLVRFASMKYSNSVKNLNNRYMHLTNYSINKKNNEYQSNGDDAACQGHKWTMKSLWSYLKKRGIDSNRIWDNIVDLIIKTVICSEACVNSCVKANVKRRYSCHELFGFDVMLDDNLKPWIIEVNISPSLHSNSPLDINVKGGMIKDLFNLAGFTIPDKHDIYQHCIQDNSRYQVPPEICIDKRLYPTQMSPDERAKHAYYCQRHQDEQVLSTLLDILTPDDLRVLTETLDEESRRGNFQRVFPSTFSHKYLRFFEQPRYSNLMLDVWVQRYNRMEARGISLVESLCQRGIHLENPTDDPRHQWAPPTSGTSREPRVVSAPGPALKFGVGSSLPTLRKKKLKSQQDSLCSLTGTPSSRPSTNRSAFTEASS